MIKICKLYLEQKYKELKREYVNKLVFGLLGKFIFT